MSNFSKTVKDNLVLIVLIPIILIPFNAQVLQVKNFYLSELAVPVLWSITVLHAILVEKSPRMFFSKKTNLTGIFLAFFMFVLFLNYLRNPLLPSSISEDSAGGFKTYYRFFCGALVYMTMIYWINRNNFNISFVLQILAAVCLFLTLIGLLVRYAGIEVPGIDFYAWSANVVKGYGAESGSIRQPFLELFAQIGLFLTLAGTSFKGKIFSPLFSCYFITCILLGGGRIALVSTIAVIPLWFFLKKKYLLTGLSIFAVIFVALSIKVIYEIAPTPQLKRLTDIGSLEETSTGRHYLYKYGLQAFLDNPLIGTGYGSEVEVSYADTKGKPEFKSFVKKQLSMGGHATHIAILKNMGLLGYLPFILMWIYPAVRLLKYNIFPTDNNFLTLIKRTANFSIIIIGAYLIRMLVEGNGSDLRFYMVIAIASSVLNQIIVSKKASIHLLNT